MRALALLMALMGAQCLGQARLTVAAAADLNPAAQEIAEAFGKKTGIAVSVSYGASGNIASQIKAGAPYDVYLSADSSYPEALVKAGLASGQTEYAKGRLVLWVSNRAGVDLGQGIALLRDGRIARISVANPEHAPYGRAAMATLRHFGLAETLKAKLVFGENVSQAAQFAESGNAQAALISVSMATKSPMRAAGKYIDVPAASYPALQQAGVVVRRSRNPKGATAFLEFLKGAEAKEILRRHGFITD